MSINGCNGWKIVAFYPAHSLKPPATKETTRRTTSEDKFTAGSNSSSYSSNSSSSRKRKKIHHRRCVVTNDPSSPKVGCMGQVKGSSGGNGSSSDASPLMKNKFFYLLVSRIFSGRSMTMIVGTGPRACAKVRDDCGVSKVYVVDFDRPLPVVKQVATSDAVVKSDTLWKRRCGGYKGLQGLQL